MGRRDLPPGAALRARAAVVLAVGLALGASCRDGPGPTPAASPTATTAASPTTQTPAAASPSATPDPLASQPASVAAAIAGIAAITAQTNSSCPKPLEARWNVLCGTADVDGDGKADAVYLAPLAGSADHVARAVILVRRATAQTLEAPFAADLAVDAGSIGRGLFSVADRSGDATAEIVFLVTRCSVECESRAMVMRWDGSAWRDIGPGDGEAEDNVDAINFQGSGARSSLTVYGGALKNETGAGPQRRVTTTYELRDGRYVVRQVTPDRAVYLYHAILDADALFRANEFEAAAIAYAAAAADTTLRD